MPNKLIDGFYTFESGYPTPTCKDCADKVPSARTGAAWPITDRESATCYYCGKKFF